MKTLHLKQPQNLKAINILLAVLFVSQGILNLSDINNTFDLVLGIIQILLGVFYIFLAQSFVKPNSSFAPRISLSEDAITLKKGFFQGAMNFKIEDIKLIQFKPENLTVMTKEFDFSYSINYEALKKQEIIEEVELFAKERNIPIEHVSYRHV